MDTPAEVKKDQVTNIYMQRTGSNNNADFENYMSQNKQK